VCPRGRTLATTHLFRNLQQTPRRVDHTLPQAPQSQAQDRVDASVIVPKQHILTGKAGILQRLFRPRDLTFELRKLVGHNIRRLTVREIPRRHEKPFPTGFGLLRCEDVGECEVADVDPEEGAGGGEVGGRGAGDEIANALVRGVYRRQGVEVVDCRAKDQRWVASSEGKVWLFLFDKGPRCLFGKGFAGALAGRGVFAGFFFCDGVPIGL